MHPGSGNRMNTMIKTGHPHSDLPAGRAEETVQVAEMTPAEPVSPPAEPAGTPAPAPSDLREDVGDPVCWLNKVCPGCGLFIGDVPPTTCPRCGEALPG